MPQDPIEKTLLSRVRLDGRVGVLRPLFWTRFSESWYITRSVEQNQERHCSGWSCACVSGQNLSEVSSSLLQLPFPTLRHSRRGQHLFLVTQQLICRWDTYLLVSTVTMVFDCHSDIGSQ